MSVHARGCLWQRISAGRNYGVGETVGDGVGDDDALETGVGVGDIDGETSAAEGEIGKAKVAEFWPPILRPGKASLSAKESVWVAEE